jgi:hypothetical protein
MIELQKKVIEWGNSAGIYVPRKYLGRTLTIKIPEEESLTSKFIWGPEISMECYGYKLLRPSNYRPSLYSLEDFKQWNTWQYGKELINIMLPEDNILLFLQEPSQSRLFLGVPVMLRHYRKAIDFTYLTEEAKKLGKEAFLGYLLEITLLLFQKFSIRKDFQKTMQRCLRTLHAQKGAMQFLRPDLERIYKKTKYPERIEATKRDALMKKWNIAYIEHLHEFERIFELYHE